MLGILLTMRLILKGWWFDPWQDDFKYFIISMYKGHLDKPYIELLKTHLSANPRICKLHTQMSNVHMCVVPGPASQVAVIKRVYSLPGLQCVQRTDSSSAVTGQISMKKS